MTDTSLVDICFNFTHESFRKDEPEVLQRAINASVTQLMVTGASLPESQHAIALADKYPDHLHATVGVHPHLARDWETGSMQAAKKLAQSSKVRAIGECGLDYNRDFSPREKQRYALEAQLELAAELELPVFLHERDAHDDFIELASRYLPDLPRAVVHCFTGEASQLTTYLEQGFLIGITGWICDERRGHHLKDFIGQVPRGRLMIETDAPYLLPRDLRPKPKDRRNEPMHLPHIARVIAEARGESFEALAHHTSQTAREFFRL